jgi:hypothetical protein
MGKQPAIGSAFLLFELHKLDESMDELLINQVNNWLIQTVLRSENEGIRNMSETIVRDMVECRLSKVTPAANDSEWEVDVECILRCLLEAIDMARNFTGLNYHGQLASFFASIEHCIVSPALNILVCVKYALM